MSDPIVDALRAGAVTGYAEPRWCTAGEPVQIMLSGPQARLPVSVSRLLHSDPNPNGPGVLAEAVDWGQPAQVEVIPRDLPLGSYAIVSQVAPLPAGGGTVAVHVQPTLLRGGWHSILARVPAEDGFGFGLFIGGDGILAGCAIDPVGRATWVSSVEAVHLDAWQAVVLVIDTGANEVRLAHRFEAAGEMLARSVALEMAACKGTRAPLLLGAAPDPTIPSRVRHHLNGLLARPLLLAEPLEPLAVERLLAGGDPGSLGAVLAAWSFSDDVTGTRMIDRSPHGAHGVVVNAPARAVPGPGWAGRPADRYVDAPERFDAIHLHDDDLDDADWPASLTLKVPANARSGIYAVQVDDAAHGVSMPFVVADARPAAAALVLIPSLSWQAYSTNRQPFTWTDDGVIDLSVGTYDLHADGSPVYYTSSRRPHRAGQPDRGFGAFGAHNVTANLYLINWLEATRFRLRRRR